ncbi:MAG TPA: carbohydrate binding family 9 domain-containing protein, partial [Terriglobales bacterium]|nr:carbohydrate binding family 9 domain-containing protein [Terriglobales bacterium]
MHLLAKSGALFALSALATALAWGRAPNDPAILSTAQLTVPKLQQRPTLEEFLGMKATGAGLGMLKITGFKQREPKDGAPVSQPTEVYVGYTDKNLYVVFICFDEPRLIRARMERRELIEEDDQVGFVLDTFNDHKAAVFFYLNPLGIQQDGIWTEPGGPDYSYDMVWHSDARLTERGYVGWFEIPFKSLRFPARAQQKWGL